MAATATATVKRSKIANVKRVSIDHASTFLETLPDKPKEELSLREAVRQLRDQIVGALAKGYSYEELAKVLTEKGIEISPSTLKNYLPAGRRQSAKENAVPGKTRAKRGQKATDDEEEALAEAPVAIATPEEEPEPEEEAPVVKRRRGRTAAAKAVVEEVAAEPEVEEEEEVEAPKPRTRRSANAKAPAKTSTTRTATRRTSAPKTTTRSSATKGNGRRKKS
jgi:hypothetical protein